jgi:hypothetical protein
MHRWSHDPGGEHQKAEDSHCGDPRPEGTTPAHPEAAVLLWHTSVRPGWRRRHVDPLVHAVRHHRRLLPFAQPTMRGRTPSLPRRYPPSRILDPADVTAGWAGLNGMATEWRRRGDGVATRGGRNRPRHFRGRRPGDRAPRRVLGRPSHHALRGRRLRLPAPPDPARHHRGRAPVPSNGGCLDRVRVAGWPTLNSE